MAPREKGLTARALETVQRHAMLTPGDAVVLGVSGGADSMALLHWMRRMQPVLALSALLAVHVHHGIRGPEADRDAAFVQDYCAQAGIACSVQAVNVPAYAERHRLSEEDAGRTLRYRLFGQEADRLAQRQGLRPEQVKIATAHNQNDNAETLLLHLIRGCGLRGLCGIPPVRGRIVRPLLECRRAEIERYCAENGLPYVLDSTNDSSGYRRNIVRHTLLPQLEALNPAFVGTAAHTAAILRADEAYLEEQTVRALGAARLPADGWSRPKLSDLPDALLLRCCAALLRQAGGSADYAKAQRLADCIRRGGGGVPLDARRSLGATHTTVRIVIQSEQQPGFGPAPLLPGRSVATPDGELGCRLLPVPTTCPASPGPNAAGDGHSGRNMENSGDNCEIFNKKTENDLKNKLDYDKLVGSLFVRTRLPGDRIRLAGRGCTKSLKKLFNEAHTPRRDAILILSDEAGLVWVQGFGVAERVGTDQGTTRVLQLWSHGRQS